MNNISKSVPSPASPVLSPPAPSRSLPEPDSSGAVRLWHRLPDPATAVGLFLAARLIGVAAVTVAAVAAHKRPLGLLSRSWDSVWYLGLAHHGYGHTYYRFGHVLSDLAFFPLYPGLIRATTAVSPLEPGKAALLLSWTAAAVAAWGIYAIGARLHGRAVAIALVLLWGLLPHSVVLSMAYTEPVFTAFAAWSLYAVLTRRWLWAGSLALLAGLSRPSGFAVAAAVLAAAAVEVWRARGRASLRLWAGAALAPLGWTAYVLWVGKRTGDLLGGYFAVQRGWGSRLGLGALRFSKHLLLQPDQFVFTMSLVLTGAGLLLYVLLLVDRAPLPLVAFTSVLVLVALGNSAYFECKPRFLLPAFPLLLPLAQALVRTARARPMHAAVVACALAGLSVVYGAYLVVLARLPV
ncbi:hypothetical protein [Streptomyces spiralis]|uniref:hypothetical protein n=1 Tax=Streptomyces spiralis TaxID=66376 RepID=UPI003F4CC8C3